MARQGFLMLEDRRGLREESLSLGRRERLGRVEQAAYLGVSRVGFFEWLLGKRPRVSATLPFDHEGRDTLGLLSLEARAFDGGVAEEARSARGIVRPLAPREDGDELALRDFWVPEGPVIRIVDAVHFGIEGDVDAAVAFAQSPLVVARPIPRRLGDHVESLPPELRAPARAALGNAFDDLEGFALEVRAGDTIEVLGIPTRVDDVVVRFDLRGRTASYREAAPPIGLVLGDAPGVRMVLRAA
jgi:hypothetical protein